jgi:NAD(P)-dependent dehydrogenase (short-subunit alcohol dehydrogenase family)
MANIALITGAAKRIGRELALHYAKAGWHIAIHHYRSIEEAIELQAEVRSHGGKMSLFQCDFADKNGADELFNRVTKECGIPRLIINNASAFLKDEALVAADNFSVHMAVNCFAPLRLTELLAAKTEVPALSIVLGDATLEASWKSHYISYRLSRAAASEWVMRAHAQLLPKMRLHELLLGPTLRNEHESEAHFTARASETRSSKPTSIDAIAEAIDKLLAAPDARPAIDLS